MYCPDPLKHVEGSGNDTPEDIHGHDASEWEGGPKNAMCSPWFGNDKCLGSYLPEFSVMERQKFVLDLAVVIDCVLPPYSNVLLTMISSILFPRDH